MSTITRSADHMYTYEGEVYRGVTGVLSVIDKSGPLMSWAARQTAEAAIGLLNKRSGDDPSEPDKWDAEPLIQLLATVGEKGTVSALSSRANWTRDEAASLGTRVHELADLVVNGKVLPPNLPNATVKRVMLYHDWWKASGWTLRTSEAMLVNPTCGYGGTLDLLAKDRDGRTVLADIKTGKAVYQEAVLQLTAYAGAEYIQPPSDNVMVPAQAYKMPKVDRCVILHVTADGVREVEIAVGTQEWIAWIACLDLAQWRDSMKGKRL